jgi:hypothetical protein
MADYQIQSGPLISAPPHPRIRPTRALARLGRGVAPNLAYFRRKRIRSRSETNSKLPRSRGTLGFIVSLSENVRSNTLVASGLTTLLLMLVAVSAIAQDFGTAEEARAMLDRAVAALKSDKPDALREFNDPDNKQFHDRDLYVSCFNISDGKFTAAPPAMLGMDIRTFNVGAELIGQRAFDVVRVAPEGTVVTMDFDFPKAGKPAVKQSLETRVGDQGCGVSYYK